MAGQERGESENTALIQAMGGSREPTRVVRTRIPARMRQMSRNSRQNHIRGVRSIIEAPWPCEVCDLTTTTRMPTERLATPSELPEIIPVHAGAPSEGPCVAKPGQCPSRNRGQPILSHGVPGGERWPSTAAAILERLPRNCRGNSKARGGALTLPG